ncbi:Formin 1, related, partial [Eimeria tenella]
MLLFKDDQPQKVFEAFAEGSSSRAAELLALQSQAAGEQPTITVRATEPPPLPIQPGGDRNPALLTAHVRRDMALRAYRATQTPEERRMMLEGGFLREQKPLAAATPSEVQGLMEAMT